MDNVMVVMKSGWIRIGGLCRGARCLDLFE